MSWRHVLLTGDCREVMARFPANSADAIVTDPPYGLEFMAKGWDKGIPGPEFWAEALRVAKPGAYLLAFGGTRTYHRLTCAIEDAGWEIRDCLSWLYGSGFPKSLNVGNGRGTALKPAWEPVVMARKPLIGTVAANIEQHGTGAINIDACRIGTDGGMTKHTRSAGEDRGHWAGNEATGVWEQNGGRWPANVTLDPEAAAQLDEQTGVMKSGVAVQRNGGGQKIGTGRAYHGSKGLTRDDVGFGDVGGASRFYYCAKASAGEREAGVTIEPVQQDEGRESDAPGANNPRNRGGRARGNNHPTVKPVELMRWLVRLVTPPGGIVLDPFMGSGSTGVACRLEGRGFVGIDLEERYVEIARQRCAHG